MKKTPSAADIEVPDGWPSDPMGRIRWLIERSGPSANDKVIAGITGCIDHGFDTRAQIMDALTRCGLGRPHIGVILTKSTGLDPERHLWRLDAATKRYSLHPATESPS